MRPTLLTIRLEVHQFEKNDFDYQQVEDNLDLRMQGQESGSLATFGPATKDYYDSSQWGMVPIGNKPTPSVQEVYNEPTEFNSMLSKPRLRLSNE